MNITRHNYEEFFILYMDNELSDEQRRAVELFARENPDLQQELDCLLQTKLVPDAAVVFVQKEQLLKDRSSDLVNTTNYEEWLLLYIDNELTAKERMIADELIGKHAVIRTELDILQKTKLVPETIVFRNKEILYRKEEKVRIISMQWRRIAVAAVLLITCSTTLFLVVNRNHNTGGPLVIKEQPPVSIPALKSDGSKQDVLTSPAAIAAQEDDDVTAEREGIAKREANGSAQKDINAGQRPVLSADLNKNEKQTLIANNKIENNGNHLPAPDKNPNMNPSLANENSYTKVEMPEKKNLTNINENNIIAAVTPGSVPPLDYIETAVDETSVGLNEEEPGKKSKLRGFFRKVTRTIEKRTNIKATDDEDRLLLAGFAVKL